jgi:mRNA interferase MazF
MRQVFYVPERGDLVRLAVPDRPGAKRSGPRLAVILSPQAYNGRTGQALVCPVVAAAKGYPFEVLLPSGLAIAGAILADQVKNLDWRARQPTLIGKLPADVTRELLQKLATLIAD